MASGDKPSFFHIKDIDEHTVDKVIKVCGRLYTVRAKGKQAFFILRRQLHTIQAIFRVSPVNEVTKEMVTTAADIPKESWVEAYGLVKLAPAPIASCTQRLVELELYQLKAISRAESVLPVQFDDLMRPDDIVDPTKLNITVDSDTRLNNRILDLRTFTSQAIGEVESNMMHLFQLELYALGFKQKQTPKIIGAASEGGANVFELNYFNRKAYLAQSPQFYKQMFIAADIERVYTVGTVFRAENSNTHRHLTEFTGLDLEMAFEEDYHEVVDVIAKLFVKVIKQLKEQCQAEIAIVNAQYPTRPFEILDETLVLEYKDAVKMIRAAGQEMDDEDDLTTANEKLLGRLVYEKYHTDFFVLDKFPLKVRPFYTMADPDDPKYSRSYDMFMRGEEILSGAQRIHSQSDLIESAKKHNIEIASIQSYIDAFKYGCRPHAGGGIGLERVLMLFLGLDNIRKVTAFPRDPKRIEP